jgi:hypothetical protein
VEKWRLPLDFLGLPVGNLTFFKVEVRADDHDALATAEILLEVTKPHGVC